MLGIAAAAADRARDELGQRPRGGDGAIFGARLGDEPRDGARAALLAEHVEDARQILLVGLVDDVGGGRAPTTTCACRAGRRPGTRSRARPGRAASTRRRCRARRRRPASRPARRRRRSSSEKRDSRSVSRSPNSSRSAVRAEDGARIAIERQHAAVGGLEDGARIAAGAERCVDVGAAVYRSEAGDNLRKQHGDVARTTGLSGSSWPAARRHPRAPSLPSSSSEDERFPAPKSLRVWWTFSRARSRRSAKRSGCHI